MQCFINRHNAQLPATPHEVEALLGPLGVVLSTWTLDLSQCVFPCQTDADKQTVLSLLEKPLQTLKQERGYQSEDIVCLTPDNPKLETILKPFEAPHYHTDDEVRTILDGEGVFTIYPDRETSVDIVMQRGDFLIVPKNAMHSFTLTAQKYVVALRVFAENPKWEAHYEWLGLAGLK